MVFFGILEVLAREFKPESPETCTVSERFLTKKLQLSRQKLVKILSFFEKKGRVFSTFDGGLVTINCPKFLDMLDEWSSRKLGSCSGVTRKKLRHDADLDAEEDLREAVASDEASSQQPCPPPPEAVAADDDSPKVKAKPDPTPHQEIVALYHELLPQLPRVTVWSEGRKALLRTRWREDKSRQNLDWWRAYFEIVKQSPFLVGDNKGNFIADLEWLCRPNNMPKVLDGRYLERRRDGPASTLSEKGRRSAENVARALESMTHDSKRDDRGRQDAGFDG